MTGSKKTTEILSTNSWEAVFDVYVIVFHYLIDGQKDEEYCF